MGRKDKVVPSIEEGDLFLGSRMRLARQRYHVSLTKLAEQLHFTKSYLSMIENDKYWPPRSVVEAYGEKFGSSELELLWDKGDRPPALIMMSPNYEYELPESSFELYGQVVREAAGIVLDDIFRLWIGGYLAEFRGFFGVTKSGVYHTFPPEFSEFSLNQIVDLAARIHLIWINVMVDVDRSGDYIGAYSSMRSYVVNAWLELLKPGQAQDIKAAYPLLDPLPDSDVLAKRILLEKYSSYLGLREKLFRIWALLEQVPTKGFLLNRAELVMIAAIQSLSSDERTNHQVVQEGLADLLRKRLHSFVEPSRF